MKCFATVLQPAPANAQRAHKVTSRREAASQSDRYSSLNGTTSGPTAANATIASSSPSMLPQRGGGSVYSNNISPSPKRPDLMGFSTPRTPNASPRQMAAPPRASPLQQPGTHDAAASPRPFFSGPATPSRETPSKIRLQHIPVLISGTPSRAATDISVANAGFSRLSRCESVRDLRQVLRSTSLGVQPVRGSTPKRPTSASQSSSASPKADSICGKQAVSGSPNGVAQPTSLAAPLKSTALLAVAASECDGAPGRVSVPTGISATAERGRGSPLTKGTVSVSRVALMSTKTFHSPLLSAGTVTVAGSANSAGATDLILPAHPFSAPCRVRSPPFHIQISEEAQDLASSTANGKISVVPPGYANRLGAVGVSGATLVLSKTPRDPSGLADVDRENSTVKCKRGTLVSAPASATSLTAVGSSAALRSAAPVKPIPRKAAVVSTAGTASEPPALKSVTKGSEAKSSSASTAAAAGRVVDSNDQGRRLSTLVVAYPKAAHRSFTPGSMSQVRSRDVSRSTTNPASPLAPSSPPQTPHKPTTVAAGVSPHTPKMPPSLGKTPRSGPTSAAASPSAHLDAVRSGLLSSTAVATGVTGVRSATAAPVGPGASPPSLRVSGTRSQYAATTLGNTLSVAQPMAPVVHVRIRPVLPCVGESSDNRQVYFLDHQNIMVVRTRLGTSTANASMLTLPSALMDLTASRRSRPNAAVVPMVRLSSRDSRTLGSLPGARGAATSRNGSAAAASAAGCGHGGGKPSVSLADAPGKRVSPESPCGGDLALLGPSVATDSLMVSKSSTAATVAVVPSATDGGGTLGVTPNTSPASGRLQSLSVLQPPPLTVVHNRTISWTSQGSEEQSPSSRLSCGSPSTFISPQQPGFFFPGGCAVASLTPSALASAPRRRPWLTTFKSFTEDEAPSVSTTPREPKADSCSGGACAISISGRGSSCGAARSGRETAAPPHRKKSTRGNRKMRNSGILVSTGSSPTMKASTRKNSAATTPCSGNLQASAATFAPRSASSHRRASRSILGASVSVSEMSITAGLKGGVGGVTNGVKLTGEGAYAGAGEAEGQPQLPQRASGGNNSISTTCAPTGAEQHYSFEFVHDEEATQADVFEESVLRFADEALLAQNVAIICYGPTGSGKTHSMMGGQVETNSAAPASSGSVSLRVGSEKAYTSKSLGNYTPSSPAPLDLRGRTPHSGVNHGEAQERINNEAAARASRRGAGRGPHGVVDDDGSDSTGWTKLGSGWPHGYSERIPASHGDSAAPAAGREDHHHPHGGGSREPVLRSSKVALESASDTGGIEDMGILPRLVHTLLERRGETIAIRRDLDRDVVGRSANSSKSAPQSTTALNRTGALSLTLRHLTFYGIELYMDELCDLLDPGKRPIQAVSDTGGLEVLCQRINEARDYRISGRRAGTACSPKKTTRAGGGMSIASLADLRRAYRLAHSNRVTARHAKNDTSSRSHAVFLLQLDFDLIESTDTSHGGVRGRAGGEGDKGSAAPLHFSGHAQRVHSYVAMVDLAGCERVKQTKVEGAALREAQYINKSLSAVSSVVLSLHHNNAHIPYRDSKLTRLLRPCLEGGRVLTLVHVAPCSSTETVNTLNFADQIRHTHIPTHRLTPTSLKDRELLGVFADLSDPMQGQWEAQVNRAQLQLNQLCADIRLSYFSRAFGSRPRRAASRDSLPSDVVSELSAASEVDDMLSVSSVAVNREESVPLLTENATDSDKARFARRATMHRLMGPIVSHQRAIMREAVQAIRHHRDQKVLAHNRHMQQRIDEMQTTLQRLTTANTKLARENSTPLPRDPHALELNRRIRESTEELGEYAKEQAALASLTTVLRQRLAAQDDVEAAVDEQLHKVQHRISQAMRTLSAAVAAHPPGDPPCGSEATSPKEPTLPTGSPSTTALVINTNDDPELRDIAHQQLSLAKELAALRLETACFEIGTGLWEGLWARAMRKEIITAMEVEVFAMERILLDPRTLALMITAPYVDVDGEGGCVEDRADATALPWSPPFVEYPRNSVGTVARAACGPRGTAAERQAAASLIGSSRDPPSPETSLSTLWTRLNNYLQGEAEPGDERNGTVASQEKANADERGAPVQASPLQPSCSHRDHAVDLVASVARDESLGSLAEPLSIIASSSESLALRHAVAAGSCTGTLTAPSPRKGFEESVPNPLMVLVSNEQQGQPCDPLASASCPQSSRHNSGAAALLTALTPLSLSGSYDKEQSFQEACLQVLLREGIPCEVCCLGESASHTLRHYILPSSADAPLVEEEEEEHEESTANLFAAPVRYHVTAAAPSCATEESFSTSSSSPVRRNSRAATGKRSSPVEPCERPDGLKDALCTTRQGRLRLVRMPRRPNSYALEFVYVHQALPLAPRLQAAMVDKPEEAFTTNPGKTKLEQMVDALPSVQGVAGRGGGGGTSNSNASRPHGSQREHRLFSIPLFEPTLRLHLHVLEEGIPNMTTPVAATVVPPSGGGCPVVAGSTIEDPMSASSSSFSPALCVARRLEGGPQIVVEVCGVPETTSTRRSTFSASAKKTLKPRKSQQQQLRSPQRTFSKTGAAAGIGALGGKPQQVTGNSPPRHPPSSQSGAAPSASTASSGSGAAAWRGLVLAKRLGNGGELMLPSSCILANTGCCSLVLRFPAPFFASTSQVDKVEAVVGALCSILRRSPTEPEVRVSSSSLIRRDSSARRGLSTSAGGTERSGSVNGNQQRSGVSHLPLSSTPPPPDLEVVNYVHVPHIMLSAISSGPQNTPPVAGGPINCTEGLHHEPRMIGSSKMVSGNTAASSLTSLSMTRSDSLGGLGVMGGGVLGHALQSSCSSAYGYHPSTVTPASTSPQPNVTSLKGDARLFRGNSLSASPAASWIDEQNGATLQVQFYWITTPLNIVPSRLPVSRKSSGGTATRGHKDDGASGRSGLGSGQLSHQSTLTVTATAPASEAVVTEIDCLVRPQVQAALSILAQLSYVFIGGRPASSVTDDDEHAVSLLPAPAHTESFSAHRVQQQSMSRKGTRPRSRSEADAAQFCNAVAVAFQLRQLDTYRQLIRSLFRQQLYDAEDVNGDVIAPPAPQSWLNGDLGRGAYLRDMQGEVKRTIGLPASTFFGSVSGGAALSLAASTGRRPRDEDGTLRSALLEPEGGDAAPHTQVTVADAREASAATVPWSVWQWAYRWFRLKQLLQGDSASSLGSGDVLSTAPPFVAQAEAAAAWLPLVTRCSGGAGLTTVTTSSLHGLCSVPDSPTFAATASSSSDEGFMAGGDWLTEAKLAARSKRVWFKEVLSETVPSYLESCTSAGQ
ncbi:hypothetical protein JKF63_05625 [Porcisia hertigi]|uniref:Kinesin motor domain-containing protein n=1 Tax=Porcisia hertigi TaxID=2761500 RepID=A0A836IQR7_9TRYP|nr:hypothetical protein JKF63_05625 [Porcisia hertigi]